MHHRTARPRARFRARRVPVIHRNNRNNRGTRRDDIRPNIRQPA